MPVGSRNIWAPVGASSFPYFALLYLGIYGAYGTESPFFPSFLESRGLSADTIAVLIAVRTLVGLAAGPLFGLAADSVGTRLVLAAALAGAGTIFLLYLVGAGFWVLLAIGVLHAAALAPLTSLADALAVTASAREKTFAYGWVRGAGSAGFIAGTLVSGWIVARFGLDSIIAMGALLFLAAIAPIPRLPPSTPAGAALARAAIPKLLARPAFRRVLVVSSLVTGSHAMSDTFAIIQWRGAGIGAPTISLLWSIAVVSEVAVFFAIGPALLRRLGPTACAMLAAGAGVLRWGVLAQNPGVTLIAGTQLLHGLTFALLHLACMQVIAASVPKEWSATAQALYGTFFVGLATALVTLASGRLYGAFGAPAFWVMAGLCAAALPFVSGMRPDGRGEMTDRS